MGHCARSSEKLPSLATLTCANPPGQLPPAWTPCNVCTLRPPPPPHTSVGSEGDGGTLPTGPQGSHFQQVATSWHQVPELKAGCVGVGLELRPFWRAQGTQVGEAEGMAELVWP